MQAEQAASERPPLGGRDVDEHGVNSGLLRCPRCLSRLVSCRGRLHERQGPDTSLWVPRRPGVTDAPVDVAGTEASASPAPEPVAAVADGGAAEVAWDWTEQQHTWWWSVADMEEVAAPCLSLPTPAATPRVRGCTPAQRGARRCCSAAAALPASEAATLCRSTTEGCQRW